MTKKTAAPLLNGAPSTDESASEATPLYHQLRRRLEQRILDGEFPVESRLPTEQELCKEYEVSRITCRKALGLMEGEGLIHRLRGRGSFVRRLPVAGRGAPAISRTVELRCVVSGPVHRRWTSPWFREAFEREFPGIRLVSHDEGAVREVPLEARFNGIDLYTVGPAQYQTLQRRGLLEKWSELLGNQRWQSLLADIPDDLTRSIGERESEYLLPLVYSPVAFIYHRRIFSEAGIPEPRFNWSESEFFSACEALHAFRPEGRRLFPFFCNFSNQFRWPLALYREGGRIWSEDGLQCRLDEEASLRGLRFYREMIAERKWGHPYHGDLSHADHSLFSRGHVAIQLGTIITVITLIKEGCTEWGIAAVPEGRRRATLTTNCLLAASPHVRDRELVAEFIEFTRRPDLLARQFQEWEMFNTSRHAMREIRAHLPREKQEYIDAFSRLTPEISPLEYPALLAADQRLQELLPLLWIDIEHVETHAREIAREINAMPALRRLREAGA
ncbi:MAG TPA: extracellular solute-binding protein [Chthoniobacteraceae bacterium]|nr:extracellular solute-binding protein [Chthoniobacteraceae bacterium]